MQEQYDALESQIREIYGGVIYTHKTHEKCADILKCRGDAIKLTEILLAAATTTTILVVIFGDGELSQFVAALFSTLSLCITLYGKDYNLASIAEKHKHAALEILGVRDKLLSLLVDIKIQNKSIIQLQEDRDNLNEALLVAYKGAPKTISKAYKLASVALQENEEFTFSDEEIDKFLPEGLRRRN